MYAILDNDTYKYMFTCIKNKKLEKFRISYSQKMKSHEGDLFTIYITKLFEMLNKKIILDCIEFDRYGDAIQAIVLDGIGTTKYHINKGSKISNWIESERFKVFWVPGQMEIEIPELCTKVTLYTNDYDHEKIGDVFVKKDGCEYTNKELYVFGKTVSMNQNRNDLWVTHRNFFVNGGIRNGQPIEAIGHEYIGILERFNGKIKYTSFYANDHDQLARICNELCIVPRISWRNVATEMITWFDQHVVVLL